MRPVRFSTMLVQTRWIVPAMAGSSLQWTGACCRVRLRAHCRRSRSSNEVRTSLPPALPPASFARQTEKLERIHELDRERASLLRKVLRTGPISYFAGIARLGEETSNLIDNVLLGGVQLFSLGPLQILLCDTEILAGFAFIARLVARRELWGDNRSGFPGWRL